MATTTCFEADLYPVSRQGEDKGKADKSQEPNTFEFYISNFFGDHQIYLNVTDSSGNETQFHLTKKQAADLADSLDRAVHYIGYDNT